MPYVSRTGTPHAHCTVPRTTSDGDLPENQKELRHMATLHDFAGAHGGHTGDHGSTPTPKADTNTGTVGRRGEGSGHQTEHVGRKGIH